MKLKAAAGFCGCFSLLGGTLVICGFHMLRTVSILTVIDSVNPLQLGANFELTPTFMTFYGAWNLAGVPLIILAGISAMYNIETHLHTYLWYIMAQGLLDGTLVLQYIISGSVCDSMVPKHVQRMGPAFVCTITEVMLVFWIAILVMVVCYFYFIIWSMAKVADTITDNMLKAHFEEEEEEQKPLAPGVYAGHAGTGSYPISGTYGSAAYQKLS